MARRFRSANSEYLEYAGVVVAAVPMSFACWFRPVSASGAYNFIDQCDGSGVNYVALAMGGYTAGRVYCESGGGTHAETTTSILAGVWQHAVATFPTVSTGSVYLNGGGKASFTGGTTPSGHTVTSIGTFNGGSFGLFSKSDADYAHVAVWNVALTDLDAYILAKGVSPLLVQRSNLVAYWPLDGLQPIELDRVRSFHMKQASGKPVFTVDQLLLDPGIPPYPELRPRRLRVNTVSAPAASYQFRTLMGVGI